MWKNAAVVYAREQGTLLDEHGFTRDVHVVTAASINGVMQAGQITPFQ